MKSIYQSTTDFYDLPHLYSIPKEYNEERARIMLLYFWTTPFFKFIQETSFILYWIWEEEESFEPTTPSIWFNLLN